MSWDDEQHTRSVPSSGGARFDELRRRTKWVASAVWRSAQSGDGLAAATIVADALDAVGIENRVHFAAATVARADDPALRTYGPEAIVIAPGAGALVDLGFSRFGTSVPYLVAMVDDDHDPMSHRVDDITVTLALTPCTTATEAELPDEERALVLAQGLEVAGVGTHVAFDDDVLVWSAHPLIPSRRLLRQAINDESGESAHRLAGFRASRNDHLTGFGHPWSVEDLFRAPTAMPVAA